MYEVVIIVTSYKDIDVIYLHISDISIKTTFRYHQFTLQSLCYIQQNVLSLNRSMDLSAPNKPCIGNPPFLPDIPHKNNEKRVLLQSQI